MNYERHGKKMNLLKFVSCALHDWPLECLGNVVFGIPHEHFFDFGAEFFFSGAEFSGSPLNGAE